MGARRLIPVGFLWLLCIAIVILFGVLFASIVVICELKY